MSDWDTVTILRKKAPKASALKTEAAINAARRQGVAVDTQQKYGAGTNKQHITTKNTAKLDRETEELRHDKVPLEVGKIIMQGRQAKGLSQKELATKICEKQQVVTDYEAGRGIPNNMVLGKIERVIGVKLRGKDRGQPMVPPGKNWEKHSTAASTSGGNSGGDTGVLVGKQANKLKTEKPQQNTTQQHLNSAHSSHITSTASSKNKRK